MKKVVQTETSNVFAVSIILFIFQKIISYIAYLFLVGVVLFSLVSFLFLYTSVFQNNPSTVYQASKARENLWHLDLPGLMKGVAILGLVFMALGEVFNLILKKCGRKKIKVSTKKKIIVTLAIIVPIHLLAIISVSFNNGVKASDKAFFYVFLIILMIASVVSVGFYFLINWLIKIIDKNIIHNGKILS